MSANKPDTADKRDNLRKRPRLPTNQDVSIYDSIRDISLGKLVNIHEEGLMLISGSAVAVNHLYQFELRMANAIDGKDRIKIGAECLWINETGTDEHYWAGFQIIDVAEHDRPIISQLVEELDD